MWVATNLFVEMNFYLNFKRDCTALTHFLNKRCKISFYQSTFMYRRVSTHLKGRVFKNTEASLGSTITVQKLFCTLFVFLVHQQHDPTRSMQTSSAPSSPCQAQFLLRYFSTINMRSLFSVCALCCLISRKNLLRACLQVPGDIGISDIILHVSPLMLNVPPIQRHFLKSDLSPLCVQLCFPVRG